MYVDKPVSLGKRWRIFFMVVVLRIKFMTLYISGNKKQLTVILSYDISKPKQAPTWPDNLRVQ